MCFICSRYPFVPSDTVDPMTVVADHRVGHFLIYIKGLYASVPR